MVAEFSSPSVIFLPGGRGPSLTSNRFSPWLRKHCLTALPFRCSALTEGLRPDTLQKMLFSADHMSAMTHALPESRTRAHHATWAVSWAVFS